MCDNIEAGASEAMPNSVSWAKIPAFPGYEVSNMGYVRNSRGKILRQQADGNNALKVHIGKSNTVGVHRLVLTAFTGHPLVSGYYPVHLNGDRADNREVNLAWGGHWRSRVSMRGLS